jgi:DNA-binding transcriptional ArsR family regulator
MLERDDKQAPGGASWRARSMSRHLPEEAVDSVAALLRVIAEPTRIRLMEILGRGSASVQGLAVQLAMTYQNVSKHLEVLREAGIVTRRVEENRVHYELIDFSGWWMVQQAGASLAAEGRLPSPTSTE